MNSKILDGKKLAKKIREEIAQKVIHLKNEKAIIPGIAVIILGEDPASHTYVNMKEKACKEVGFYSEIHRLQNSTKEEELLKLIEQLNHNEKIHGILVQLPLPDHINENIINAHISPFKDVDGFHPSNLGKLFLGQPSFVSCTPKGIIKLLKYYGVEIRGKHAVVIGRSNIVGKPIATLLLNEDATVTLCHSKTRDLAQYTQQADIIVSAVGKAHLINHKMIKREAIIIDAGMNRLNGSLVGDIDFHDVIEKVKLITPVPGGVGPMTITMLLENTLEAALRS
ncbi:bifunctional methylenetetrahydrofolate dehydrogenase/methenyltetrahydrofolate cyclohydrolase FolD [Irregularibacter muris]|uniref:Bifunctional protein FolD n=1 Tax=Irregularibacter muris TaxID=1796619 RepID=A0AAE3HG68_9FIRM|nr:bifunctional methylenetetrahydrofolate dehydrogenase/methenyltetrahydrofolate cyclohydrolase FolD [Irregularibacter muris]MCR1897998.1 bifunctional methylenetetrahydrofolate dehydrogenase/methenyltetrahydrofolate cyclohydrolase FolD [Irregularibacter muris]